MTMNFKMIFAALIVLVLFGSMSFASITPSTAKVVNYTATLNPSNYNQWLFPELGIASPRCQDRQDMAITDPTADYMKLFGTQFWQSRGSGFSMAFTNTWTTVCNTDWYVDGIPVQYTNYRGAAGCNTPSGVRAWILINVDNVTAKDGSISKSLEYGYHDIYGLSNTAHGWITESFWCHETTKHVSLYVNMDPQVKMAGSDYSTTFAGEKKSFEANVMDTTDDVSTLKVAWDLDGDGAYDDAKGTTASYTFGTVGTYSVSVMATDRWGATGVKTFTVDVKSDYNLDVAFSYSCNALACTFSDDSIIEGVSITSRCWFFGDNATNCSDVKSPKHTYAKEGDYTVKLNIKTTLSLTDSATKTVTVANGADDQPVADFSVNCTGKVCIFTDKSANADSVSWDFGDGSTSKQSGTVTHTYATTGTYLVELTAANDYGTDTRARTAVASVISGAEAVPEFTASCTNLKCTFIETAKNADSVSWNFGDGTTSAQRGTIVHNFAAAGTYYVRLAATNCYGTNTATQTIAVFSQGSDETAPTASFRVSCDSDTLKCTFTDLSDEGSSAIESYAWKFGDGRTSISESPTHIYADADTYDVTLKVTDENGLSDEYTKTVDVTSSSNNENGPTAKFSYECDDSMKCKFTDKSTEGDYGIDEYYWDFGDGEDSYSTNPTHTYDDADEYEVTLTVTDDEGNDDSASRNVDVSESGLVLTVGSSVTVNAGDAVQFSGIATSDSKILLYEWDFDMNGTGFRADYMNNMNGMASHVYSNAGTYTAVFKVTTASGSSMATRTITVIGSASNVTTTGSETYEAGQFGMSSARTYSYDEESDTTTVKLKVMNTNETAQTVMIRDIVPKTFAQDVYAFSASPKYTKVYNVDPEVGWQTTIQPYETYTITYTFDGYKSLSAMKKGFDAPTITLVSVNETAGNQTAFTGLTAFVVGAFADPIMALIILLIIIVIIVVLWAWSKNRNEDDRSDDDYSSFGTQALIKKDLEMHVNEHNLDQKIGESEHNLEKKMSERKHDFDQEMDESKHYLEKKEHSFVQKMDESKKSLEQEVRDQIKLLTEKQKLDQKKQNGQMQKKMREIKEIQQKAKKQIRLAQESARKEIKAAKADLYATKKEVKLDMNATKKEVKEDIKDATSEKKKKQ